MKLMGWSVFYSEKITEILLLGQSPFLPSGSLNVRRSQKRSHLVSSGFSYPCEILSGCCRSTKFLYQQRQLHQLLRFPSHSLLSPRTQFPELSPCEPQGPSSIEKAPRFAQCNITEAAAMGAQPDATWTPTSKLESNLIFS